MIAHDILLDNTGETLVRNGDFVQGPSDAQHVQDLITFTVGSLKQFPLTGVGIIKYVKSKGQQQKLEGSIKLNLEGDGYSVPTVSAQQDPDGKFRINMNPVRNG